jgi:hypothetical protein
MPKGPQGQKRPADVIGNAVHVMRIATGQIEESVVQEDTGKNVHAVKAGRLGGLKGGKARAEALTPKQRSAAAKRAAKARWKP